MRDKLMQKLEKKGKKLSPIEKKAKTDVVKSLSSQAGKMLGDKVKALKSKVGKTGEGNDTLEKYEKKAAELTGAKIDLEGRDPEEMVEESEEEMGMDLDNDEEHDESAEHKAKVLMPHHNAEHSLDMDDCSEEEIDKKIQELLKKKQAKSAKKE